MPLKHQNTKSHKNKYASIPQDTENIEKKIVHAAYLVHKVICEIRAVEELNPVWEVQILNHLKLTNRRLAYLINFNVGEGIKRFIR
ncbi:MAG: GxxExxY protein [Bacteroidales bacterium]